MPNTSYTSVDSYLAAQPSTARAVLETVRRTIRTALPDAEETISYQIPAYKFRGRGRAVIYFAGWKDHFSIYPVTAHVQEKFKVELARYDKSKGTIRFPLGEPVPVKLIGRIARVLAEAAAGGTKSPASHNRSAKAPLPKRQPDGTMKPGLPRKRGRR